MLDIRPIAWLALGEAAALVVVAVLYVVPRLVRSAQGWMSAVLFSSLSGWDRRFANASVITAIFWVLVIVGAVYSPAQEFVPAVVPTVGGIVRHIMTVNLWVISAAIPLIYGAAEGWFARRRGLELVLSAPAGYPHLAALAVALLIFLPWITWRRVFRIVRRHSGETHEIDIEAIHYGEAVLEIARRFEEQGCPVVLEPAYPAVRVMRWLIDHFGPRSLRAPVPYGVKRLVAESVSVVIYSNLLDITAPGDRIGRVRAALFGALPPEGVWWTRSESARALEATILGRDGASGKATLESLGEINAGVEEWRALEREYLQAKEANRR